ncbi:MAG: hypothetical protein KJI69_04065 [Patescibacteria group bacterium]|nr:hypothetical protein [Patescibacteria group bacterium]
MAGTHLPTITMIIGFILVLDSFLVIQNMFTGATVTFTNGIELLLGLVVIGIGFKLREMKA